MLRQHYGAEAAAQIQPATFVLSNPAHLDELLAQHTKGTAYLLKSEAHRQSGLHLAWDADEVVANAAAVNELRVLGRVQTKAEKQQEKTRQFTVAQVFLTTPYRIGGHSITLRMYLVVATHESRTVGFYYSNGKVNYSHKPFEIKRPPASATGGVGVGGATFDQKALIASGYGVPKWIYETFPYSFQELLAFMQERGDGQDPHEKLVPRIKSLFGAAVAAATNAHPNSAKQSNGTACKPLGGKEDCFRGAIKFQHFGVDIAVDAEMRPWLLEINKGPDMKGVRADVRDGVFKGIWQVVGTHGPVPDWGSYASSSKSKAPEEMVLVYDSLEDPRSRHYSVEQAKHYHQEEL